MESENKQNKKESKIKYGIIIPLVGGMAVGNEMATGQKPNVMLSYPAFAKNDAHAKLNFPDVPFLEIDEAENKLLKKERSQLDSIGELDFVSAVCPCAGLSTLNSSNRGADAPQNDWLYKTARFVFNEISPKVFWGENAPALGSASGEPVADKLYAIGKEYGYSFTIVKTDTRLHGIPQRRTRTFYFFWKGTGVPILNSYARESPSLAEYIDQVPKDALYMDEFTRNDFDTNGYLKWFYSKPEHLDMFAGKSKTVTHFAKMESKWDELISYLEEHGDEKEVKFIKHAKYKVTSGKNFWDSSPYLLHGRSYIQAIQGRVFEHAIHHSNERYVSIREHMHLMGLPHDYQLTDIKHASNICQNVPTCTARDMTLEVVKYINGELDVQNKDREIFNNMQESKKEDKIKAKVKLF